MTSLSDQKLNPSRKTKSYASSRRMDVLVTSRTLSNTQKPSAGFKAIQKRIEEVASMKQKVFAKQSLSSYLMEKVRFRKEV